MLKRALSRLDRPTRDSIDSQAYSRAFHSAALQVAISLLRIIQSEILPRLIEPRVQIYSRVFCYSLVRPPQRTYVLAEIAELHSISYVDSLTSTDRETGRRACIILASAWCLGSLAISRRALDIPQEMETTKKELDETLDNLAESLDMTLGVSLATSCSDLQATIPSMQSRLSWQASKDTWLFVAKAHKHPDLLADFSIVNHGRMYLLCRLGVPKMPSNGSGYWSEVPRSILICLSPKTSEAVLRLMDYRSHDSTTLPPTPANSR
jgi:hypothetical protein